MHLSTYVCTLIDVMHCTCNLFLRKHKRVIMLPINQLFYTVPPNILDFTITPVGSPTAGSDYSLRCEVSLSISGLVNPPTAVWSVSGNDLLVSSSGDASTLTFSPLRTLQAATYTCTGQLVSPALQQPLTDVQTHSITVDSECILLH